MNYFPYLTQAILNSTNIFNLSLSKSYLTNNLIHVLQRSIEAAILSEEEWAINKPKEDDDDDYDEEEE